MANIDDYVGTWTNTYLQVGDKVDATWYAAVHTGECTLEKMNSTTLRIESVVDFGDTGTICVGADLNFAHGVAISNIIDISSVPGTIANALQLVVNLDGGRIHFVHFWIADGVILDSGIWTNP